MAIALGGVLSFATGPARALEAAERVSLLTMGPGDHPFTRFGHNALLLEWPSTGRALVFNYGTFVFEGWKGIRDFMAGRFRYWLSVSSLSDTLDVYRAEGRSLVAQELELSLKERSELTWALFVNARPENAYYDYDYYLDNCSTRVRDLLDRVLGGQLRQALAGPGRLTFRQHTARLVASELWLYVGLDLALGPRTDRPTTRWEELFLPGELHDALALVERPRNGRITRLVRAERVLLETTRAPELREPPSRRLAFGLAGLMMAGLLAALGRSGARNRLARIAFGLLAGLLGLALGLLGTSLLFLWLGTRHHCAHQNLNILLGVPWSIGLGLSGAGVALGRPGAMRWTRRLAAWGAVPALLAGLLALVPGLGQDNTRAAALLSPLWLGLCVGSLWLGLDSPPAGSGSGGNRSRFQPEEPLEATSSPSCSNQG